MREFQPMPATVTGFFRGRPAPSFPDESSLKSPTFSGVFPMKTKKPQGFNNPFEALGGLLKGPGKKKKPEFPVFPKAPEKPVKPPVIVPGEIVSSPEDDDQLFSRYTGDVRPFHDQGEREPRPPGPISDPPLPEDADAEALGLLKQLIEGGTGFVVSHTGEYIEGTGYGIHPDMAKRLHAGEFSVQAHLDLHGMLVDEAEEALDEFLTRSLAQGLRAVLVVHGRGRSSRNEPLLKNRVLYRLTKGAWRKWVIAFASARSCDGGAGATYVLFRNRPVTGRQKKKT